MNQKFHTTKIWFNEKKLTTAHEFNEWISLDRQKIFMFDLQKPRSRESSGNQAILHESAAFVTTAVMFVFYLTTVYV